MAEVVSSSRYQPSRVIRPSAIGAGPPCPSRLLRQPPRFVLTGVTGVGYDAPTAVTATESTLTLQLLALPQDSDPVDAPAGNASVVVEIDRCPSFRSPAGSPGYSSDWWSR